MDKITQITTKSHTYTHLYTHLQQTYNTPKYTHLHTPTTHLLHRTYKCIRHMKCIYVNTWY